MNLRPRAFSTGLRCEADLHRTRREMLFDETQHSLSLSPPLSHLQSLRLLTAAKLVRRFPAARKSITEKNREPEAIR